MLEQLRQKFLARWAHLINTWPWTILVISLLVSGACIWVTAQRLEFLSNRNDLLSDELAWNQVFTDWTKSFAGTYDLYVIVDAQPGGVELTPERTKSAQTAVDALGKQLSQLDSVERVVWGFDPAQVSPRAIRIAPKQEFDAVMAEAAQSLPLLNSATPGQMLQGIGQSMREAGQDEAMGEEEIAAGLSSFIGFFDAIREILATPAGQSPPADAIERALNGSLPPWEYLTSANRRLYFIRVTPKVQIGQLTALEQGIVDTRAVIDRVMADYPQIQAGLTGIEVVEHDETEAIIKDSSLASALAFVLIAALLILAYQSVRTPALAMFALLIGIAWSFGFLTLVVGHLQLLSVFFAAILLGLGIAYGIHLASCFELVRLNYPEGREGCEGAIRESFQIMGPGIFTGAITTAAAFGSTLLTDFDGVREMGLIAAGGVMLCLLAMFTVFPACLCLFRSERKHVVPMRKRWVHMYEERWSMPFVRHPVVTLSVAGVLLVVSLIPMAMGKINFDYDLLNLYPPGLDSVQWQRRIAQDGGESIWTGTSIVGDLDTARAHAAKYLQLPTVGSVRGVGLLFPADEQEKLATMFQVRKQLEPALSQAIQEQARPGAGGDVSGSDLISQVSQMQFMLAAASIAVPEAMREPLANLREAMNRVVTTAAALEPALREQRLREVQQQYHEFRMRTASQIDQMLDASPLTVGDLPAEVIRPYHSDDGRFALEVVPRLPVDRPEISSPLDPQFLPYFITDMKSVDPKVTGVIVQIYNSSDLIKTSYQLAGIYALIAVFVLVLIDFQSARAAALSLLPVVVGFAVMFGIMWLVGMSINAANITVLPLMFGIGVDSGVHMLHRFKQNPDGKPQGLTEGTGKGVTITSFTAMIGFGAMMIASHRGIQSLGFVLTLGIGLTLLACWTVMPAWLELRARQRTRRHSSDAL